jgi:ribonucleoside-diphosphate reductase alpha chain
MDNNLIADYSSWEAGKNYPEWMDEISLSTISRGYLLPGEDVRKAYRRVARAAATRLKKPELENKFFKLFWQGWVGLASPVISNMGTDRGLPISCYGIDTPDSIRGIGLTNAELMRLTSKGGGVGISVSRIRPRGEDITGNGKSEGVVPWCKIYDSTIIATNQGNVRRGAASVNLDISHPDIDEFLQIRRPKGDPNRQCLNLHQCVVVDDIFMRRLENRDPAAMNTWATVLKARMETGEPYVMYKDNVNKDNPIAYRLNNLEVTMTNICSEITLFTDEWHSFICCFARIYR